MIFTQDHAGPIETNYRPIAIIYIAMIKLSQFLLQLNFYKEKISMATFTTLAKLKLHVSIMKRWIVGLGELDFPSMKTFSYMACHNTLGIFWTKLLEVVPGRDHCN